MDVTNQTKTTIIQSIIKNFFIIIQSQIQYLFLNQTIYL